MHKGNRALGKVLLPYCLVTLIMLSKNYRLKKKSAFNATYRVKNSVHKGGVILFAGLPKKDENTPTKFGFVVSKKTHKRAVKRNRLRRLMRESVRLLIKSNEMNEKYMSMIFVGHEHALGKNFDEICGIIRALIEKV